MKPYKRYYIETVGDDCIGMTIHHIDKNRDNNHISNLVALPADLHEEYHRQEREIERMVNSKNTIGIEYHKKILQKCLLEIEEYISIRDKQIKERK